MSWGRAVMVVSGTVLAALSGILACITHSWTNIGMAAVGAVCAVLALKGAL